MISTVYPQKEYTVERYELPDGAIQEDVKRFTGTLPQSALHISGLVLDSSTFDDVKSVFGQTKSLPQTDDPHEAETICYVASGGSDIYLSFSAGWPENETDKLTSFTLSQEKVRYKADKCNPSKMLTTEIATANGLRLGLTQADVETILGVPSKRTQTWMIYSYEKYHQYTKEKQLKYPKAPGGGYYKGEWSYYDLLAKFSQNKLIFLQVSVSGETEW